MTHAQQRVLQALIDVTCDGWPCTVRQIGARAGLASTATVQAHLRHLIRDRLVERHPRNPRGGFLPTAKGHFAAKQAAA